jgi:hypothetical protein
MVLVMANVECGSLLRNDRTGNRTEAILGECLVELVLKKVKGMMSSMGVRCWPLHCVIDFSR